MLQLNYYIHIILNSRYKFIYGLSIYLLIFLIYNLYIADITISECMKRAHSTSSPPSTPQDTEYIQYLENENKNLKEHIYNLESNVNSISSEVHELNISALEENQTELLDRISSLESQVLEAQTTMGQIAGTNMDLRTEAYEKQLVLNRALEKLEIAKKQCAESWKSLHLP